jgi:hypothetical protein
MLLIYYVEWCHHVSKLDLYKTLYLDNCKITDDSIDIGVDEVAGLRLSSWFKLTNLWI